MKSLNQTLKYKNPEMILRIRRKLPHLSRSQAEALFGDLLTWLWLCAKHGEKFMSDKKLAKQLPDLRMLEHFIALDKAWHEFILMTHDYHDFCHSYLGRFIHHKPAPINSRNLQRNSRKASDRYLTHYFNFIADHLGTRRLRRWVYILPTYLGAQS